MKKTFFTFCLPMLLLLLLSSCNDFICLRGNGNIISENRSVAGFKYVDLQVPGTLYISPGTEYSVRIETSDNLMRNIQTRIYNNELRIRSNDCIEGRNNNDIKIYISTPSLERVTLSGSGEILGMGTFVADRLEAKLSGSGEIQMSANVKTIKSQITGSGVIKLTGSADNHEAEVTGSGNIDSFGLQSVRCKSMISGSGNCQVKVSTVLDADISGSGNVRYKGQPLVNTRITGSGRVINAN